MDEQAEQPNEGTEGHVPAGDQVRPPWAPTSDQQPYAQPPFTPQPYPAQQPYPQQPSGAEWAQVSSGVPGASPYNPWGIGTAGGQGGPGAPAGPGGPYGPYGYGMPGDSQPPQPPHRRRNRVFAVVGVAALLVASTTAGIAAALTNNQEHSSNASTITVVPPVSAAGKSGPEPTSKIAATVDPAVVDINTVVQLPSGQSQAAGTGMIVTSNGEIVTNNHVVQGAISIKVTIAGHSSPFTAQVVGTNASADVAVLKVSGVSGLPTVKFADSSSVVVGATVVAIGNALGLGGSPTVTNGTVTALDRSITASDETGASEHLTGMLQTDAQIQPGNSGGPLVNGSGQVIGMDTAAASASSTSSTSLGFAIPSNRVVQVAKAIQSGQSGNGIVLGLPAFLGIDGQDTTLQPSGSSGSSAATSGADIVFVQPGSPAAKAGIIAGDVIIGFDGKATPSIESLAAAIHAKKPGDTATVTFEGANGKQTVTVHLVQGPAA